ncbi:hypothetical protein [Dokdonella sp.]|uniref:hypothetical protein n=1 Tax=Dokdonella sp. TaxID=2291710 RepID=UPI0031C02CAF|nr:hypothetical protein [Dokdonella sp.]
MTPGRSILTLFGALAFTLPIAAGAQEMTPYPFCTVCPAAAERPSPRSGFWYDVDRPGSSMTLENQGGTWAGVYYGYDDSGAATWYLYSGVPERAAEGTGYWKLEAELLTYASGNCIDCDAEAPELTGSRGTLELAVVQRNVIRYRVDGGETHTMEPLVWGTHMKALLPDAPEARLPLMDDPTIGWDDPSQVAASWVVTERGERIGGPQVKVRGVHWLSSWEPMQSSWLSFLGTYAWNDPSPPVTPIHVLCGNTADWTGWPLGFYRIPDALREQLGDAQVCILAVPYYAENKTGWFVAQPGDVGDDYFFAVAADGRSVLEGTRLFYR